MASDSATVIGDYLKSVGALSDGDDASFSILSGGNSHITWRVRGAMSDGSSADYVVKIAQEDGPLAPYDVGHEARMMKVAHDAGVPAPALVGYSSGGPFDFVAMKFVAGESPTLAMVRDWVAAGGDARRLKVASGLVELLLSLHAVDMRREGSLADHYRAYLDRAIEGVEAAATGVIDLPATFRFAHEWLAAFCGELDDAKPCLHHGDFRLGNATFRNGDVAALLDWERAMVGHPLHDVGYLCLPGMRFDGMICGIATQQEFERLWREQTGKALDVRRVAYFRNLAVFTELCAMVRAMARAAAGKGRIGLAREIPLVARVHQHLIDGIRKFDDGDFGL